jgi:hypothetical protein
MHHQAVGINVVIVAVGPIDQPFTNIRSKMRRRANGFRLPFKVETYRSGLQPVELRLTQNAALDHLRQHDIAALERALGI